MSVPRFRKGDEVEVLMPLGRRSLATVSSVVSEQPRTVYLVTVGSTGMLDWYDEEHVIAARMPGDTVYMTVISQSSPQDVFTEGAVLVRILGEYRGQYIVRRYTASGDAVLCLAPPCCISDSRDSALIAAGTMLAGIAEFRNTSWASGDACASVRSRIADLQQEIYTLNRMLEQKGEEQ